MLVLQRIYTEAHLYDDAILDEIEDFAFQLEELVKDGGLHIPRNVDLVLELEVISEEDRSRHTDQKSGKQCLHHWTYYYANHDERVLFWLQPFEIIDENGNFLDIEQVMCVQSESHIGESCGQRIRSANMIFGLLGHAIESYYWCGHSNIVRTNVSEQLFVTHWET